MRKLGRGALLALLTFAWFYRQGRRWGATPAESRMHLPGDDIVPDPSGATTHAISIEAPPADVWPWIVQMGYHRGGWYTYPWVDRFVWHIENPSANEILPQFQDVRIGSIIPDGEPGTAWYVVERFEPDSLIVLHSTSHIPASIRRRFPQVGVDWTWTFSLMKSDGGTRLLLRVRPRCEPWWFRVLYHALIVPSDFVMARSMLRGIKERAESHSSIDASMSNRVSILGRSNA